MKIVVIDGQGGALGKSVITALRKRRVIENGTGEGKTGQIFAVGTNSTATAAMLSAGADHAATGENPVLVACADADAIMGPIGIVIANSMFGEITPAIAKAVGRSQAKKFLIPVDKCNVTVIGTHEHPYSELVKLAADAVAAAFDIP
ncbi:MAG: DUF3842 family protein [Synergistaceae bacterium]|jgi:hypothetical protein|nr:DUF3842 family protein [Synergistaceae bacterium]